MGGTYVSGGNAKSDCMVKAEAGGSGVSFKVKSKNLELAGPGLNALLADELGQWELPGGLTLELEEFGALDWVIRARVEEAVRAVIPDARRKLQKLLRSPLPRDLLCRTRLYVPGNNPRLLQAVEISGADLLIMDLEDSVPEAQKAGARIMVRRLLEVLKFNGVFVRINALEAGGTADVAELIPAGVQGIALPKAEDPAQLKALSKELDAAENALGLTKGSTVIMPIIESARGVENATAIAGADKRVLILAFGAEDYSRDVHCTKDWDSLLYARSRVVTAARAAGVFASDTVYGAVEDLTGMEAETRKSKALGFDGKGIINPRQIEVVHSVYMPTQKELEEAQAVIAAADEAEAAGKGAVSLNGRMVDLPVVLRARHLMKNLERMSLQ